MKITLEQFHQNVGEILMYCQCVEENVKRIYAHMQQGDYSLNRLRIDEERMTLGQVITAMKALDQSRKNTFFTERDYGYLFLITKTRNEYAHNVYTHFCYLCDPDAFDRSYDQCVDDMMKDKVWLSALYEAVEDARLLYEKEN